MEVLRITPMIKSLLDRFERNGMRRISSWILALLTAGWIATASSIYKGLWFEGEAMVPHPAHLTLLWQEFLMILAFYIARTVLPLGMRIAAVYLLKDDAAKLLTMTPDPDPIEDPPSPSPPSLEQIKKDIQHYKEFIPDDSSST